MTNKIDCCYHNTIEIKMHEKKSYEICEVTRIKTINTPYDTCHLDAVEYGK